MAKEYGKRINNQMIAMKDNIRMIKNVAMEFSNGHLEILIKDISLMTCGMVKDKCIGMMEVTTKEVGKMEFNMEKV
jgi:hypothetical protein